MNYYDAREMVKADGTPSGKFHYTVMNDNRTHAVGYCAQGCKGHDTPDEACEHYKQYVLDTRTRYGGMYTDKRLRCEICGEWTQRFAEANMRIFTLCDTHCTRENVSNLYGSVGIITSSY